jgi:hypothetical protein
MDTNMTENDPDGERGVKRDGEPEDSVSDQEERDPSTVNDFYRLPKERENVDYHKV